MATTFFLACLEPWQADHSARSFRFPTKMRGNGVPRTESTYSRLDQSVRWALQLHRSLRVICRVPRNRPVGRQTACVKADDLRSTMRTIPRLGKILLFRKNLIANHRNLNLWSKRVAKWLMTLVWHKTKSIGCRKWLLSLQRNNPRACRHTVFVIIANKRCPRLADYSATPTAFAITKAKIGQDECQADRQIPK